MIRLIIVIIFLLSLISCDYNDVICESEIDDVVCDKYSTAFNHCYDDMNPITLLKVYDSDSTYHITKCCYDITDMDDDKNIDEVNCFEIF